MRNYWAGEIIEDKPKKYKRTEMRSYADYVPGTYTYTSSYTYTNAFTTASATTNSTTTGLTGTITWYKT